MLERFVNIVLKSKAKEINTTDNHFLSFVTSPLSKFHFRGSFTFPKKKQWPKRNFSLQYQYIIKWNSDEKKEKINTPQGKLFDLKPNSQCLIYKKWLAQRAENLYLNLKSGRSKENAIPDSINRALLHKVHQNLVSHLLRYSWGWIKFI